MVRHGQQTLAHDPISQFQASHSQAAKTDRTELEVACNPATAFPHSDKCHYSVGFMKARISCLTLLFLPSIEHPARTLLLFLFDTMPIRFLSLMQRTQIKLCGLTDEGIHDMAADLADQRHVEARLLRAAQNNKITFRPAVVILPLIAEDAGFREQLGA